MNKVFKERPPLLAMRRFWTILCYMIISTNREGDDSQGVFASVDSDSRGQASGAFFKGSTYGDWHFSNFQISDRCCPDSSKTDEFSYRLRFIGGSKGLVNIPKPIRKGDEDWRDELSRDLSLLSTSRWRLFERVEYKKVLKEINRIPNTRHTKCQFKSKTSEMLFRPFSYPVGLRTGDTTPRIVWRSFDFQILIIFPKIVHNTTIVHRVKW